MGITDHRKTWQFTLHASPQECIKNFIAVFDGTRKGEPMLTRAKWDVRRTSNGAKAAYGGRKGIVGAVTALSQTASNEQSGALRSEVTFEVRVGDGGITTCTMHLSSFASTFGFTNDARFIRPYMQRVQHSLKELDPQLVVHTS